MVVVVGRCVRLGVRVPFSAGSTDNTTGPRPRLAGPFGSRASRFGANPNRESLWARFRKIGVQAHRAYKIRGRNGIKKSKVL